MPQPQIPYDYTPLLHHRLTRPSCDPSLLQQVFLNPSTGPLPVLSLLIRNRRVSVGPEPDFCRSVFGLHGYEGYVYDHGEGNAGVVEVGVVVGGLGGWRR